MNPTNKKGISLDEWKENRRRYGRQYAIMQDMIQLGFLDLTRQEIEVMKRGMEEQASIQKELRKIDQELRLLPDVETILKKIRLARMERVRRERAERRVQKQKELVQKKAAQKQQRLKTPFYLGEGVSAGLRFEGTEIQKLEEQDLPLIEDVSDLAKAMEIPEGQISCLAYHRKASEIDHYDRYKIPKKSGGIRLISSSKPLLRKAQEWILDQVLNKIPLHPAAKAFRKEHSIVDNAKVHVDNQTIIKMDLKDFFPSIRFRRVKGLFQCFGYNEGVASIFALLCTDSVRMEASLDGKKYHVALGERYLPQGACTSAAITNIICKRLDARMTGLCNKLGFVYSRYADDMVISHPDPAAKVGHVLNYTKEIIEDESFVLHPDKLKVMRPHQRQAVTGVVVNEKLAISRKDMRAFRSFLHHYEKEGVEVMNQRIGKNAENYAKGYWAFIKMVNEEQAKKVALRHPWIRH